MHNAQNGQVVLWLAAILLVLAILVIALNYSNPMVREFVGWLMQFNGPTGIKINGY